MRSRPELAIALALLVVLTMSKPTSTPAKPGVRWTDDEMRAFIASLGPTGVPLDAMLAIMCAESGLDPHASSGTAWGLNQAQAPLLRAAGWTSSPASYGALSVTEQLPWVAKIVRIQLRAIGYVPQNAAELYRLNLSPKAAKARSEIIYDSRVPTERAFYEGNKGLDHGKKGYIDQRDLEQTMAFHTSRPLFKAHLELLRKVQSADGTPSA